MPGACSITRGTCGGRWKTRACRWPRAASCSSPSTNNTGTQSARWKWIKRTYSGLPRVLRVPFAVAVSAPGEAKSILRSLLTLKVGDYARSWTSYGRNNRGMSCWHDIVDWVGGYPYEVAHPEEIFDFYRAREFTLTKLKCGGVRLGCNEFVFEKRASS